MDAFDSTAQRNRGLHAAQPHQDAPNSEELLFDADELDEIDELEELEEIEDLETTKYMQNRELSWLTFNERVLDQGADESVPLLERLNFISIFWSNLQEFFMVRVGSLTDLSFIKPPVRDSKTDMTPKEQIKAIHERCAELYPIQESYYEHVRGSLAKEGVRHLRPEDLSDEQFNYLSGLVKHNIEPFLSPQIINSRHPFPHLENGKLYILVRLDEESDAPRKKKGKAGSKGKGAKGVVLGLIPLPHQVERLIKLPGKGYQFILLEHAIEMFAEDIFSMYKVKHTNVICVTRNADMDANQGDDSSDEDYREHMRRLLKQRARLAPVRLECERPLSPVMEKLMLKRLGLKPFQVYDTTVPLDLSFTWELGSKLTEKKRAKLSNPPFTPVWPSCFDKSRRILDQVSEKEVILSYPYESMDPFVQLLREAAYDPDVISIKITLYRLARQSHLAEALIAAAENGKEVTALFELRARFDESNNIEWSQRFEEAGCNVLYGFRDYKVHSKICCITRRTDDGIQRITQLGTGNYNEKTAKLYTDLSFITTDESFGRDAVEFFKNMQLEHTSDNYNVLCVAPLQIKPAILAHIDEEIEKAKAGLPCGIFMKANSITDKDAIEKIAEASQAGVPVTLLIRGICCIVPDVKGATENVKVFSIVGRLLEHSRIYCFGAKDDAKIFLSSADLMTRNLDKRIEIAWPVFDTAIKQRILDYIDICLSDTAKLRQLRPNLTYTPLGSLCEVDEEGNAMPTFDAQVALIEKAAKASKSAQLALVDQDANSAAPEATKDDSESVEAAEPDEAASVEPAEEAAPEAASDEAEAGLPTEEAAPEAEEPAVTGPEIAEPAADAPEIVEPAADEGMADAGMAGVDVADALPEETMPETGSPATDESETDQPAELTTPDFDIPAASEAETILPTEEGAPEGEIQPEVLQPMGPDLGSIPQVTDTLHELDAIEVEEPLVAPSPDASADPDFAAEPLVDLEPAAEAAYPAEDAQVTFEPPAYQEEFPTAFEGEMHGEDDVQTEAPTAAEPIFEFADAAVKVPEFADPTEPATYGQDFQTESLEPLNYDEIPVSDEGFAFADTMYGEALEELESAAEAALSDEMQAPAVPDQAQSTPAPETDTDFFAQNDQEIQVPAEKKPGFFSRLFNRM